MSGLEDLVRRSLAAHEHEAPTGDGFAGRIVVRRRRRNRQRALALLATLSLIGVVVAIAAVSSAPKGQPAVLTSAPPPVPAGMRAIGYRGVEMFVPVEWQQDRDCSAPTVSTYRVGDGASAGCGRSAPDNNLTYVVIHRQMFPIPADHVGSRATEPTTVDGAPAHQGTDPGAAGSADTSLLYLDRQGLLITVRSPDAAARKRLIDSVHLFDVDRNGCAVEVPDLDRPSTSRTGSELVPGEPTKLTACYYTDRWIRGSATLTDAPLTSLAARINALPSGVAHAQSGYAPDASWCQTPTASGFLLHFGYAASEPSSLVAMIEPCADIYVGDAHGTSRLDYSTTRKLVDLTGYDGGWTGPGGLVPG